MNTQKKSRLDKLFNLLQNGSTPATRREAGRQITEIAKANPAQLPTLQRRLATCLSSSVWETRVAAGDALGRIAEHFQQPTVHDCQRCVVIDEGTELSDPEPCTTAADAGAAGGFSFETFNMQQVLDKGTPLLASAGQEFDDLQGELAGATPEQRLEKQRKNLKTRLGIGEGMNSFMDTHDLVADEDLIASNASTTTEDPNKQQASQLLDSLSGNMSARERNKLKRKEATLGREEETAASGGDAQAIDDDIQEWKEVCGGKWIFQRLTDQMCTDVLHPKWQVRHGAAVGLREILRSHASSAGMVLSLPVEGALHVQPSDLFEGMISPEQAQDLKKACSCGHFQANLMWLQDCVIRVMCVLALDRFGDYVSDQVVAPVRETAAQALGAASKALPFVSLQAVMSLLKQLKDREEWQVRHGCILGWKYILAARKELAAQLLPEALPALLQGLHDKDDDVRAAAAEALLPVTGAILAAGQATVDSLRDVLWDILLDLQELSPSTASVMHLLAELYSDPTMHGNRERLGDFVPRLWPFFRHTLRQVRAAAVACLQGVLQGEQTGGAFWLNLELERAAAMAFQNLVLEEEPALLRSSVTLFKDMLSVAAPHSITTSFSKEVVGRWLSLAATPPGAKLDIRLFVSATGSKPEAARPKIKKARVQAEERAAFGGDRVAVPQAGDVAGSRAREACASAIGHLAAIWPSPASFYIPEALAKLLANGSATGRQVAGMVLSFWVAQARQTTGSPARTPLTLVGDDQQLLENALLLLRSGQPSQPTPGSAAPYKEVAPLYHQMQKEIGATLTSSNGLQVAAALGLPSGWSASTSTPDALLQAPAHTISRLLRRIAPIESWVLVLSILDWCCQVASTLVGNVAQLPAASQRIVETLGGTLCALQALEALFHSSACAALADAVVAAGHIPPKLTVLVQPLMLTLRKEPDPLLVRRAAESLTGLAALCVDRKPTPNAKVISNLCGMACGDPDITPDATAPEVELEDEDPYATPAPAVKDADRAPSPAAVARAGAEAALMALARGFGPALLESLPKLADFIFKPLHMVVESRGQDSSCAEPQPIVNALQVLAIVGPSMDAKPWQKCLGLLPALADCCQYPKSAVRCAAASAAAALAQARTDEVMPTLLELLVPMMSASSDHARRGACMAMDKLVSSLRAKLAAYTVLMLVPLLGRMADPLVGVRRSATAAFAHLVELLPLSQGLPPPCGLCDEQLLTWKADSCLLEQLLDNRKTADYALPPEVHLSVTLRPYQQEGLNWLAFLRKFQLHGVLADDMGLGKTLQAIAITAAATAEVMVEPPGSSGPSGAPSLIACPPTLVGHWAAEIERFLGGDGVLRPLCYEGTTSERAALRQEWEAGEYNVIIMSYDSCRADIAWLEVTRWLYVILDEGHIIKNAKTKVSQAVKQLMGRHRLLLSGTPIQNDVLELWSIFDYLMPGFLGTERTFNSRFRKAVQVAKTSKKGSKEAEQGLLAADSLHKTIMPFVLRRTKDQVLKDLPPKIIQDVYCSMSPLQVDLYEHFSRSSAASEVRNGLTSTTSSNTPHVFQSLQYLRKLCSHPALVADASVREHCQALEKHLGLPGAVGWEKALQEQSLSHAPKLEALKDILCQCQIGKWGTSEGDDMSASGDSSSSGHRVLVFAQLRSLLDLVERDLLEPGGVSFSRLDGNIPANKRFQVAQQFNADPTIEVLLLTTGVGGLGLNLTTADTVVFLEHDWNPQKDLQAMDRAHRLGQKRTVNVYRLLMKDTLEEKIMGMQRFKLDVANAVVNTDNISLKNMDTGQLLDLFTPGSGKTQPDVPSGTGDVVAAVGGKATGLKAVLAGLEELWDEQQYAEEFSLDGFMQKLK